MRKQRDDKDLEEMVAEQRSRNVAAAEAIDAVAGAAGGAALGAIAGPVGMAAGAAIGAVTGAVLGHVTAEDDRDARAIENDLDAIDVEDDFFQARRSLGPPEPISRR